MISSKRQPSQEHIQKDENKKVNDQNGAEQNTSNQNGTAQSKNE